MTRGNNCIDPYGNKYNSAAEMCKQYNVPCSTFNARIKKGYSLKQALGLEESTKKSKWHKDGFVGPNGKTYWSEEDMCKDYKQKMSTYKKRKALGLPILDCLDNSKCVENRRYTGLNGETYTRLREMCTAYGIDKGTYRARRNSGMSHESALTYTKGKKYPNTVVRGIQSYDHLGNKFESISIMCLRYGISIGILKNRLKMGWSLADALTKDVEDINIECEDHIGNKYPSQTEMCRYYEINRTNFRSRLDMGWKLEEALGVAGKGLDKKIQQKEQINSLLRILEFAYIGRDDRRYYRVKILSTGDIVFKNSDQILAYGK